MSDPKRQAKRATRAERRAAEEAAQQARAEQAAKERKQQVAEILKYQKHSVCLARLFVYSKVNKCFLYEEESFILSFHLFGIYYRSVCSAGRESS